MIFFDIAKRRMQQWNQLKLERCYLNMRKLMYTSKILNIVQNIINSGDKVLDIGAGKGEVLFSIEKKYQTNSYEVDIAKKKLKQSKKVGLKNVFLQDAHKLHFKDNTFECTLSFQTIHVLDIKIAIREMERVTIEGGVYNDWFFKSRKL